MIRSIKSFLEGKKREQKEVCKKKEFNKNQYFSGLMYLVDLDKYVEGIYEGGYVYTPKGVAMYNGEVVFGCPVEASQYSIDNYNKASRGENVMLYKL